MSAEPITIAGAGPAGLMAAITLRRYGLPVRVFEMAPDVGHRLNGDFQGIENWSSKRDVMELLRECGLEVNFLCEPFFGGGIYAPRLRPAHINSSRPIFYLVQRGRGPGTLDTALKEQALRLGAEIIFNHRIKGFTGPAIVGTGPQEVNILAMGMTFTTENDDRAAVVFDDSIAPKGYAYLLVHKGYGTMATVLYSEFGKEQLCFERMLRFFNEREGLTIGGERKFVSYGNFFIRKSQVEGKLLHVGESAGFQDGLWGFGIRYALLSGHLAARSLAEGSDYDLLWRDQLKPMLETSLVNRYLFETFGHMGYRYLTRRLGNGNPCDYLRRHYNYSFGKHLLLPLAQKKYAPGRKQPAELVRY